MIQAQQFDCGYLPIQGRFHLPGKRQGNWAVPRQALPNMTVMPVTHTPCEFRTGDSGFLESRDETPHTHSITQTRVGATQKCQNNGPRKGAFLCPKIFTDLGKFALDLPSGGY